MSFTHGKPSCTDMQQRPAQTKHMRGRDELGQGARGLGALGRDARGPGARGRGARGRGERGRGVQHMRGPANIMKVAPMSHLMKRALHIGGQNLI